MMAENRSFIMKKNVSTEHQNVRKPNNHKKTREIGGIEATTTSP